MEWVKPFELVKPYVFRVETKGGSGTGFLYAYTTNRELAFIATAEHVVQEADAWKEPLRLTHEATGTSVYLAVPERVIFSDSDRDTASISVGLHVGEGTSLRQVLPKEPLTMMPADKFAKVGQDVAWVGYPSVAPRHLCLFRGCVSAFMLKRDCYLIDGVAINGVSGGPVFAATGDGVPTLLGSVSAYLPNRNRGDALPGLLEAQDLTPLHTQLRTIRSMEEAQQKRAAEQKNESAPPPGRPPAIPPPEAAARGTPAK
jgi:Trypsin-like peptidase domain